MTQIEEHNNPFEQHVIIGKSYILKLIHQVDAKIHGQPLSFLLLFTTVGFNKISTLQTQKTRNKILLLWFHMRHKEFKSSDTH